MIKILLDYLRRSSVVPGIAVFLALSTGMTWATDEIPVVRIGIVTDGPIARKENFVDLFRKEIEGITEGIYDIKYPSGTAVDGGWEPDGIARALDGLFERGNVDVVVAVGVGVAAEVCSRDQTTKPVVIPFAFGDCATTCPQHANVRIRPIDIGGLITRDLQVFHETVPFTAVAVLMDPTWPFNCTVGELGSAVAPKGVSVKFISMPPGTSKVADLLPSNSDAIYLMPLLQLDEPQLGALIKDLTSLGLPTFSMLGETEVDKGVLAGMNTKATMAAMARGSALEVLDLIEGRETLHTMRVETGGRLTLNMATAQELGFSPSWELLTRARLVHGQGFRRDRPINLRIAMDRAVTANLDLAVRDRRVAAGAQDLREAKSNYRPQIDVSLIGAAIDENHAIAALGQYSRYVAGSLTLTQLIYSDGASGNITIQEDLQKIREFDMQALRFDITRDAVAAYMGVMRSDALIRIRQEQVDLTRANLELARIRRSVGAAGAAEAYRWEAELATARAGLLDALSFYRLSERQLSRLLDEPLTTRWDLQQPDIKSALEALGGAGDAALLDTPQGYDGLISTLVEEGLQQAPELAALEAAIAAQERALTAAQRAAYAPIVALKADLNQVLAKDDTGGLDLGDIGDLIPEFDDTSWQVGVQAGLPVVTGGANKARRIKAQEELFALQIDSRNAREKLGQRTLSALDTATASWSTISLRQQAATDDRDNDQPLGRALGTCRSAARRSSTGGTVGRQVLDLITAMGAVHNTLLRSI
jgi:outer membrane protein TolC